MTRRFIQSFNTIVKPIFFRDLSPSLHSFYRSIIITLVTLINFCNAQSISKRLLSPIISSIIFVRRLFEPPSKEYYRIYKRTFLTWYMSPFLGVHAAEMLYKMRFVLSVLCLYCLYWGFLTTTSVITYSNKISAFRHNNSPRHNKSLESLYLRLLTSTLSRRHRFILNVTSVGSSASLYVVSLR